MGTCESLLRLDAPADKVWDWLSSPANLFSINMLHEEVVTQKDELVAGETYVIDHNFFGAFRQRRAARVREVRPYFVAWGEYKVPEEPGRDAFPHNQSIQVVPVDDTSCVVVNRLTGRYIFPGSTILGFDEWLLQKYGTIIIADDNQVIGVGVGAIEPGKLRKPAGLLFWPLMGWSARFMKKSTRRKVIEQMKAERSAKLAAAESQAEAAVAS